MVSLIETLTHLGKLSVDALWFPLLIWSGCALLIHLALRWIENSDVLYHYHLRVALVAGIPLGFLATGLAAIIPDLANSTASGTQLSLIVIQNPITITPDMPGESATSFWSNPYLWISAGTGLLLAIGIGKLVRMGWNYRQIASFARQLELTKLDNATELKGNMTVSDTILNRTHVAYSHKTDVPFTFGWKRPVIVIPTFLRDKPEKLRMAMRHEMMHIKRGDFLVNAFITAMKSLFWFHPLIHLFDHEIQEYREISCDSEVLTDASISRKQYASLLFELAPKNAIASGNIVSMAVNQSSLKKRITKMMNFSESNRPITKSIIISLGLLVGISGFIACSDLQDSGVTNQDLQEAQMQMEEAPSESLPLYVIQEDVDADGTADSEEVLDRAQSAKISRLKPEYIKSINVWKGEKATEKYGSRASNGAVVFTLLDKQKAFSDLMSDEELAERKTRVRKVEDGEEFFVVVEQMPELKGGLTSIANCVEYPEQAKNAGIEGRVIVQFIVSEQGAVENPKIVRGVGAGIDEEALRCVKKAEFVPGKQRGEAVRVQYSLPVVFKLPGSIDEEKGTAYMEEPKHEPQKFTASISESTNGTISGKVINDETGTPIPGVNIRIKNTNTGTSTDQDGEFKLDGIQAGQQQLMFSHIQYGRMALQVQVN